MNQLPKVTCYGNYSGSYGVNSLEVDLGSIRLYYSYRTIVAFWTPETGLVVSENVYSATTGKHLNWIDRGDKKNRLSHDKFNEALDKAIDEHIR